MKLDELVRLDSMRFAAADWNCIVKTDTTSPDRAVLDMGEVLPNESVHVRFAFVASVPQSVSGSWITRRGKMVRENIWGGDIAMIPRDRIEIEAIINPEDWA